MTKDFLYQTVEEVVKTLYFQSQKILPPDVIAALEKSYEREVSVLGKKILKTILGNYRVARETDSIVCQDTGTPVCFIKLGDRMEVSLPKLHEAVKKGVEAATIEFDMRPNMVDPITRENTKTNVGRRSPVVHYGYLKDADYVELLVVPKGSGSENMSFLKMLVPADGVEGIKRFVLENVVEAGGMPCPPGILGIGIGGSFDLCAALAKEAIARPVGSHNPDRGVAELEDELLEMINMTGVGPMGLGGNITALAVHIETAETHISELPIAVNTQCWKGMRGGARIFPDSRFEYIWSFGDKGRSQL